MTLLIVYFVVFLDFYYHLIKLQVVKDQFFDYFYWAADYKFELICYCILNGL